MKRKIILFIFLSGFSGVLKTVAEHSLDTGEAFRQTARFSNAQEMVYFIRSTGDGRWLPGARGLGAYPETRELKWLEAGEYNVSWIGVGMSGKIHQGSDERVNVSGAKLPAGDRLQLNNVEGLTGLSGDEPYQSGSVIIELEGLRSLDWLVLRPDGEGLFPADFSIQTSVDGGAHWHRVMSAEYVFFPDPGKNEVWIPLNRVVADALRIFVPRGNTLGQDRFGWRLAEVSVYGDGNYGWQVNAGPNLDTAAWSNLWLYYGTAKNEVHQRFDPWWETERPLDGGMLAMGSTLWFYWNALKLTWMGPSADRDKLEHFIARVEVDTDGYVWVAPGHQFHLGHSRHYGTNSTYIRAVAYYYLMTRNRDFLERKSAVNGETILQKVRRAMDFQLNHLQGRKGLLVFDEPDHDGTASSLGSNYWDFWLFGYKSAYDSALFYESLRMMAELEAALGEHERSEEMTQLRELVKTRYNQVFWNEETGRFIGWQDINGKRHDFGFTDLNLKALAFGLADPEKASQILAWITGQRKVESDDAFDLYHFGFATRSTTVDALRADPPVVNTWGGELDIRPGESAGFGQQIQNGGAIFLPAYHDLHARLRWLGANNAYERFEGIRQEFVKDGLRRDPGNFRGQTDVVGILREFPESGVVPYFLLSGFLGIYPDAQGLRIEPRLPDAYETVRIERFYFSGHFYEISVIRDLEKISQQGNSLFLPDGGSYRLSPEGVLQVLKHKEGEESL